MEREPSFPLTSVSFFFNEFFSFYVNVETRQVEKWTPFFWFVLFYSSYFFCQVLSMWGFKVRLRNNEQILKVEVKWQMYYILVSTLVDTVEGVSGPQEHPESSSNFDVLLSFDPTINLTLLTRPRTLRMRFRLPLSLNLFPGTEKPVQRPSYTYLIPDDRKNRVPFSDKHDRCWSPFISTLYLPPFVRTITGNWSTLTSTDSGRDGNLKDSLLDCVRGGRIRSTSTQREWTLVLRSRDDSRNDTWNKLDGWRE